jgi:hypothetical protein
MPYDPQRSHRRPRLADDAPAPIDALLGAEPPPDAARPTASGNGAGGAVEPESASHPSVVTPAAPVITAPSVPSARSSGRPRLALAALVVVVLLLAVAWVRRRR